MRDTIALLEDLIRLRPVTADVVAVNAATGFLHGYLAAEGLHCCLEEVDGRRVLYACTEETRQPEFLLNAHVDVVPGEEDQFEPRVVDGWLHGRGSNDCLGNAVLSAQVLCRVRGRASVGAVFSADEETGGATTAAMVRRGYGARRLILVLDGPAYAVAVAQKGIVTCVLTARGRAAHASTPWLGQNAIDALLDGYSKVREGLASVVAGDEWHDTVSATVIEGGTVANRVPDRARLTLNIRFTEPGGDQRWVALLREVSGLDVAVGVSCPVVVFDEATPALTDLARAMAAYLGREIGAKRMNGATDARHFAGLGVPVAILGAAGRDVHGRDEAVDIEVLRAYEEMLSLYLTGGISGAASGVQG
ncbi:MAG: M20/M25/M40 family metallo-hydrolase [Lentisphaeria bacterium]|nr:M20/M25/M40 family metallo-hydrolase [Lentisphaeria bacterium]